MQHEQFTALAERLAADGRISEAEALEVRGMVFPDGHVSRAEAEFLFRLNERVGRDHPAWNAAFIEAVTDHLLDGATPRGHLDEGAVSWLEAQIGHDGRIESLTELDLIVKLLDRAESAPERLAVAARDFVLRRVLGAADVELPQGAEACRIGPSELELIRRVLFACGAAGGVAVTRAEAEWLFALDEATHEAANDPAWRDTFVKGICNHVAGHSGPDVLAREAQVRNAAWLETPHRPNPIAFLGRAASGGFGFWRQRLTKPSAREALEEAYEARVAEMQADEIVDAHEAAWVAARVRRDGVRTGNELALIEALKELTAAEAPPAR